MLEFMSKVSTSYQTIPNEELNSTDGTFLLEISSIGVNPASNICCIKVSTASLLYTVKKEEYNVIYPMGYISQIIRSIILDYINHPIL